MGLAVLTIVVSVLSGTLLAFLPRQKAAWIGPLRTFGLAAAISVVALHMVPESIEGIGAWAVPALLAGLALPALLGRLGSLLWRVGQRTADPRHVALEAGYAGLLVHKVGDGIALGVYAGDLHPSVGSQSFAAALAAHIVPVVAIVVLTFDSVRGRGSALLRALGLALAGLLGVFLTHSVVLRPLSLAHGWLSAMAAGMLLHVVTHDLGEDLPRTAPARLLDLAMAVLGLMVSALGGMVHGDHGAVEVPHLLAQSLLTLAIETGPLLVAGLALAAWLRSNGFGRAALAGARARSWVTTVLPHHVGIEAVVLAVLLLGWATALVLGLGALCMTAVSVLLVTILLRDRASSGRAPAPGLGASVSPAPDFVRAFDERVLEIGGWTVLGLLLAALVDVSLPEELAQGHGLAQLALVLLLAVPSYLCPASAIALGLVLLEKGLSPGSVVTGLLLGPWVSMVVRSRSEGVTWRAGVLGWSAAGLVTLASGWLAEQLLEGQAPIGRSVDHEAGVAWLVLAVLSALVLLRAVYTSGFRGFLQSIEGGSHDSGRPDAAHGSGHHGHAHG